MSTEGDEHGTSNSTKRELAPIFRDAPTPRLVTAVLTQPRAFTSSANGQVASTCVHQTRLYVGRSSVARSERRSQDRCCA